MAILIVAAFSSRLSRYSMRDDLLGDVEMVGEGGQFYIIVNGVKIAKRENYQWTSLVPGYSIEDLDGGERIAIEVDCAKLRLGHRAAIQQRAGIERPTRADPAITPIPGRAAASHA
jgi:hypothetical protein